MPCIYWNAIKGIRNVVARKNCPVHGHKHNDDKKEKIRRIENMDPNLKQIISLVLVLTVRQIWASDITSQAFGEINDTIISAFGDFNSDELTDVFVRSTDGRIIEILLASDQEPLLRRSPNTKCIFTKLNITSIVPGDFDGDAYMDLLITSNHASNGSLAVYINWGGSDTLNCTNENEEPLFWMTGEPVALVIFNRQSMPKILSNMQIFLFPNCQIF